LNVFDPDRCFDPAAVTDAPAADTLYAFYDLAVSPATFDIVHFLGLADACRLARSLKRLHVVIPPGPREGFREDAVTPYDTDNQRWRLQHILVPCAFAFEACRQVSVLGSRREARALEALADDRRYPADYAVDSPREGYRLKHLVAAERLGGVRPSTEAMRIMKRWLTQRAAGRQVVSMTLRECAYETDRNSRLAHWGQLARHLDRQGVFPLVVRDTEAVHQPLPAPFTGLAACEDVVWNIDLRTALYELCLLNLFVNNGPAALARLNPRSRSLTFKMVTPSSQATTVAFFEANGLPPGQQLHATGPWHRLVWEEDTFDCLRFEVEAMIARIAAHSETTT